MKQHITIEQLQEVIGKPNLGVPTINYNAYRFLVKHIGVEFINHDDLTIGKMIEILDNKNYYVDFDTNAMVCLYDSEECKICFDGLTELCDALWEAVKYVLKED